MAFEETTDIVESKIRLMATESSPTVSVIVPTYKEAANLPRLIARLASLRSKYGMPAEVIIVDDDSQDGSAEVVSRCGQMWVVFVVRTEDRGLSQAVCHGLRVAIGDVLVVMDADLSHPPEAIPDLVNAVRHGADFAIGSRYVVGATTDEKWSRFRRLNSNVASLLARPFTTARDPMSGFFAIPRPVYAAGSDRLTPIGYKIGLELIVKCECTCVAEIPIHFVDRCFGESKLSIREQLRYLMHVRRLLVYKYGTWSHLVQFLLVGAAGAAVNIMTLTVLLWAGVRIKGAVGMAIALSMLFNFALNRRITFSYARGRPVLRQFAGFVAACSIGATLNFLVSLSLMQCYPTLPVQLAVCVGISIGMVVNFLLNRFSVFRPTP